MTDPYARPEGWPETPIGDDLEESRRNRTGPFAQFALEPAEPAPTQGPAPAVLEDVEVLSAGPAAGDLAGPGTSAELLPETKPAPARPAGPLSCLHPLGCQAPGEGCSGPCPVTEEEAATIDAAMRGMVPPPEDLPETEAMPALLPETAPVEVQPRRTGVPRSQR